MLIRFYRLFWPLLLAATVFAASGRSRLAVPETGFAYADKAVHFLVFGLLATLVVRVPATGRPGRRSAWAAFLLVAVYGGLDEFRQSFTPGRSVEFDDWLADSAGAAVAVFVYARLGIYRKVLEWRLLPRRKRRRRYSVLRCPGAGGAAAK